MKLRESAHKVAVRDLVSRLQEKHPDVHIHQDWEYGVNNTVFGQLDVHYEDNGVLHFYEVKTGKPKLHHAQEQYNMFKRHFPEVESKGVYVHPQVGVRRLR